MTAFIMCFGHLTRHKISDRETSKVIHAANGRMANTHEVDCTLSRGSLHRRVRRFAWLNKRNRDENTSVFIRVMFLSRRIQLPHRRKYAWLESPLSKRLNGSSI